MHFKANNKNTFWFLFFFLMAGKGAGQQADVVTVFGDSGLAGKQPHQQAAGVGWCCMGWKDKEHLQQSKGCLMNAAENDFTDMGL